MTKAVTLCSHAPNGVLGGVIAWVSPNMKHMKHTHPSGEVGLYREVLAWGSCSSRCSTPLPSGRPRGRRSHQSMVIGPSQVAGDLGTATAAAAAAAVAEGVVVLH